MRRWITMLAIAGATCAGIAVAQPTTRPQVQGWSVNDVTGTKLTVPAGDGRVSVIAFVRGDQPQSSKALEQIRAIATDAKAVQVVIVFGGEKASEHAKARAALNWPTVADPDFAASGKLNVHVWPTTVVIDRSGNEVAHLAGMPTSFTNDLGAYIDLASSKIDADELKRRLANRDVVTDDPQQAAARHLQVARRLIDSGQLDQARAQIDQGLKLRPDNRALSVALARVLVLQGNATESLAVLERLPNDAAPPWQLAVLRARTLIALDRWPDAKSALGDALKLNPDPGEAHYLMGLIYQHDKDDAHAAESFRQAYEATTQGQRSASAPH
jgi:tetratricopeptide (TPR) repeat protein